jgi:NAD(P)H-dependent flavin oxidoreductase YrpB (nitropropane dioxygenase family)
MSAHTPVCELLGIDHPIVEAPLAADPRLPAAIYEVGWPDASHRALHNSTAAMWEAAGRPAPGNRPREGEVIAHFASGEPIVRYEPAPPMVGTTGEIEALSLWAGQSVALATQRQPAAEIVAELVSRL